MFCKKCGTELPEGAVFCTNCGASTAEAPVENPVEAPVGAPVYTDPAYAAPVAPVKKKKKTGLVIGIIAAVVVVVIVLAIALGGGGGGNAMKLVEGRWDGVYLYSAADDSGFSLVGEGWYITLDDDYDTTFVMGDPSDPLTGEWEFADEDELDDLDGDYVAGAYLTYGGLEGIMLLEDGDDGYEMSVVFDTGDDTLVLLFEK